MATAPCRTPIVSLGLSTRPSAARSAAARSAAARSAAAPPVQQVRRATFIPRPRRPYIFTQLVQLSDGSTYTMRTTSPLALYRAAKDTRNTLRWQPSDKSLHNLELDEAGKLAAFRNRFGRGFDALSTSPKAGPEPQAADEGFADLITSYGIQNEGANENSMRAPFKWPTAKKK